MNFNDLKKRLTYVKNPSNWIQKKYNIILRRLTYFSFWENVAYFSGYKRFKNFYKYSIQRQRSRVNISTLETGHHDYDIVLLHANFQILKDFIEVELAWAFLLSSATEYAKIPFYMPIWYYRYKHAEELGLLALDHEMAFKKEEMLNETDPELLSYAIKCAHSWLEIKQLYCWWIEYRREKKRNNFTTSKEEAFLTNKLIKLIELRNYLWT